MSSLPPDFSPTHPLWNIPSYQQKYLKMHGKTFAKPELLEVNPTGSPRSDHEFDLSLMESQKKGVVVLPRGFNHLHPDYKIPSLRQKYISAIKQEDWAGLKPLIVRPINKKTTKEKTTKKTEVVNEIF